MCGIIGLWSPETSENLEILLAGIKYLHRRGPEGKGAAFVNPFRGTIISTRANTERSIQEFEGTVKRMAHDIRARMSLGQTRYITDDRPDQKEIIESNTQPIHLAFDGAHGLKQEAIGVHNGQIEKKELLGEKIYPSAPSIADVDSRFLFELYMQRLRQVADPWEATSMIMEELLEIDVAASVGFSDGDNLIAWRDAKGYRPLVLGKVKDSHVFVSESGYFDEAAALFGRSNVKIERQILPGEMILINSKGDLETRVLIDLDKNGSKRTPCNFEDIYIKDVHSLDNSGSISSRRIRENIGKAMAEFYSKEIETIDFVIPVIKSGISYAQAFAFQSNKPYRDVLRKPVIKSNERYFLSIKTDRMHSFVVDNTEVRNKEVAVIEDSIMRGDTAVELYVTLKDAGAKNVKIFSAWPPTFFDCYYGVDVKSEELIAYQIKDKSILHYDQNNNFSYDIHQMNNSITELIREKVIAKYGNKYGDAKDLEIFYSPISLIKKTHSTKNACLRCITKNYL